MWNRSYTDYRHKQTSTWLEFQLCPLFTSKYNMSAVLHSCQTSNGCITYCKLTYYSHMLFFPQNPSFKTLCNFNCESSFCSFLHPSCTPCTTLPHSLSTLCTECVRAPAEKVSERVVKECTVMCMHKRVELQRRIANEHDHCICEATTLLQMHPFLLLTHTCWAFRICHWFLWWCLIEKNIVISVCSS